MPSLKQTVCLENGWLEYSFSFGARPIFRGELLVSGSVVFHGWLGCFLFFFPVPQALILALTTTSWW